MLPRTATVATADVIRARSVDRWFYIGMALATTVTAVLGFAPSLVDQQARHAPVTPLVVAHSIVFGAWLVAFAVQATLVATGRTSLHRRLGPVFVLLAPALVVFGYATTVAMGRRGFDLSGDLHIESDPALGMVNPLGDLLGFAVLVTVGFWYRRRPPIHKRLMLLATICLMPAPLAHFIGHVPALNAMPAIILLPLVVFLFSSAVHDRWSMRRVHPVSMGVALALLAWFISLTALLVPAGRGTVWRHG